MLQTVTNYKFEISDTTLRESLLDIDISMLVLLIKLAQQQNIWNSQFTSLLLFTVNLIAMQKQDTGEYVPDELRGYIPTRRGD